MIGLRRLGVLTYVFTYHLMVNYFKLNKLKKQEKPLSLIKRKNTLHK